MGHSKDGMPTRYSMKKYIDDPKKGKPIYDLIAQKREGEIYTKFPQRSAIDAAKNFKSPLNDLSVKDTLQNDMGISFGPSFQQMQII